MKDSEDLFYGSSSPLVQHCGLCMWKCHFVFAHSPSSQMILCVYLWPYFPLTFQVRWRQRVRMTTMMMMTAKRAQWMRCVSLKWHSSNTINNGDSQLSVLLVYNMLMLPSSGSFKELFLGVVTEACLTWAWCASVTPCCLCEHHRSVMGVQIGGSNSAALTPYECVGLCGGMTRQGCDVWATPYVHDPQPGDLEETSSSLQLMKKKSIGKCFHELWRQYGSYSPSEISCCITGTENDCCCHVVLLFTKCFSSQV